MLTSAVTGFLLDTMIASWAWDAVSRHHSFVRERLAKMPNELIFISPITLAEVEYGLRVNSALSLEKQQSVRAAMSSYTVLPIDHHTGEPYGSIRAVLFSQFAPAYKRNLPATSRPERLIDRTTGVELGIQENDLWIVSVAVQYQLRFITSDRASGMRRVIEAADYLQQTDFWDPDATLPP